MWSFALRQISVAPQLRPEVHPPPAPPVEILAPSIKSLWAVSAVVVAVGWTYYRLLHALIELAGKLQTASW